MKKLTTIFLSLVSTAIMAQIPNPSFENWTSGNPNSWYVVTSSVPGSVTQSSTAHAGTYAVELSSVFMSVVYIGGQMTSGKQSSAYFYNSGKPTALNGWYISTLNGGDEVLMTIGGKCPNDSANGGGALFLTTNSAVYKQFSICCSYPYSCTPDSAFIGFQLYSTGGYTHAGSFVIIDDLSFGPCTTAGVDNISKDVTLEAAYPNPANNICNVIYSLPNDAHVTVNLYDMGGRKVMNLLQDTYQTDGRYKLPVDVSSLANGLYICNIVVNGQTYSQKISVLK